MACNFMLFSHICLGFNHVPLLKIPMAVSKRRGLVSLQAADKSFASLGLRPALLQAVDRLGYKTLTDIQERALPCALSGRDVVGKSKTGSGKTCVFGLTLLQNLDLGLDNRGGRPQALVLSPTRELASQLVDVTRGLASCMEGVRVLAVTGGSPSRDQRARLDAGAHVVVATPGRCLQLLELGLLDPRFIKCLVLDEADTLLDMGFEVEVNRIIDKLPPRDRRQTMLFSATWAERVAELSERVMLRPEVFSDRLQGDTLESGLGSSTAAAEQVDRSLLQQSALLFEGGEEVRLEALCHVLATAAAPVAVALSEEGAEPSCVVFCETRQQCNDVAAFLCSRGASALALHGDLEQSEREKVLVRFRNKSCRILVATNVASRGLDVADLSLVICLELNEDPDVHVHRVGRTARAERAGAAVSLVHAPASRAQRKDGRRASDAVDGADLEVSPVAGEGESREREGERERGTGRTWIPQNRYNEVSRLDSIDKALGGEPIPRKTWRPTGQIVELHLNWEAGWVTVLVSGGRRDKLRAGDILGALCGDVVRLQGSQVGKIEVTEERTWVAVRRDVAAKVVRGLNSTKIKNQRFRAHLIK